MKTCCCIAARRRVFSVFCPAISIIVNKQSSRKASTRPQTAPTASAGVKTPIKRRSRVGGGVGVSVGHCVCELLHVRIHSRRSIAELSLFMTVLALGSAQQNSQGLDGTKAQISPAPVSCRKKLNMKSGS